MKNFEVLDMKEESDVPEPAGRIMSMLENLNDAVDQSTLMETEQLPEPDLEEIEPKPMPDSVDAVRADQELPDLSGPDVNAAPEAEVLVSIASALPSNSTLNSPELDEAANLDPHEQEQLYQRSLSTCDIAEDDGIFCGPSSDHCTGELEMDNEDLTRVTFYPDHMVYRDSYCTDCVLTFTSSCIKLEGSTLDGDDKIVKFQWGVQDVLHIKSHWYELVEMAMVTIDVLTDDIVQPEHVECTSGAKLKFAIMGPNWYGKQEAITSLNVAYKSLWNNMLELEDTVHGQNQGSITKYFPNFDQPFEEVIYPKGDVDAVSISKRDVDLLLPDTFVNDTIIDFYIKYLKNKVRPEDRQRFHFFNSFFFRKLADPDKDPLDASKGKAAFQRVKKWTRKVNIFEKDFVFIPVNYNYHWSLIVMCHLGEIATYKDEDVSELIKVPCVLHMDSIRGSHTGLKGLMQSYLKEEWKGRQQEASEDISSRFDDLRFISLELPQQPNSFDCGLFLLHYVELFLEQAPINFNPFKITKSANFLNTDWFTPADASLKRVVIQRLVYDLLQQPYDEAPSMADNKVTAVNFFTDMVNPLTACQTSQADSGIEISLLPSLSIKSEPCHVGPTESVPGFETGSFLGIQFPSFKEATCDGYKSSLAAPIETAFDEKEKEFATGSFLDIRFPSFNEATLGGYKSSFAAPIEEDVEVSGQFVYGPTGIGIGQDNGITPEVSALQYSSQDFEQQNINFETSPETSISGCEDSLEVVNGSNGIDEELNFNELRDEQRSPVTEPIQMINGNGDADADADADGLTFSLHRSEMELNGSAGSGESSGMESDVQHPAKRMRTSESLLEGGSGCS